MKLCPNCKAALDDNARFCLSCMTSLDEKEQIPPLVHKIRRWPLVLLCILGLGALLIVLIALNTEPPVELTVPPDTSIGKTSVTAEVTETLSTTIDGVTYIFRPATREDHPTAISLDNYYVLSRVDGTPSDGIYRVPSFVGDDTYALVVAIVDGAFADTSAQAIDLGYNVRYVWGNAFGGYPLTDLYLHEDVLIDQTALSGCTQDLTIHCPEFLENTQGVLWSTLCVDYGFRWQPEFI